MEQFPEQRSVGVDLRRDRVPLAIRRGRLMGANHAGHEYCARPHLQQCGQFCGLSLTDRGQWNCLVRHRDGAGIRHAFTVPDEGQRFAETGHLPCALGANQGAGS